MKPLRTLLAALFLVGSLVPSAADDKQDAKKDRLSILFLGDDGHHRPAERFPELAPVLERRGIDLTYTDRLTDLNAETLAKYDGLIVYANIDRIGPEQERALLDFVAGGKGFIPLHCASYCFRNSKKYVELVGAQFHHHGTGVFGTSIAKADHPLMKGFGGFSSWDETYSHHLHNETNRTVLSYRVTGDEKEPWTWVRTHGKGRVFYTAWGHDSRTWKHPGFHNLLERGIRWTVGDDPGVVPEFVDPDAFPVPQIKSLPKDLKPFEYVEADVPFYPPGERWGTTTGGKRPMQKPLPAEESKKHLVTPVEFDAELFASEPDIGKPICLNFDERGRLWIAETVDYPNEKQPPGKGRDRIRICEDTDGDGRADTFTVFAENLSIPTSLTFARGGVIVHQPPETVFLKDTDGDEKADVREVLFSGWSTRDTHAGPSNLRYGLDNWIYGMVGYAGFRGTVGGEEHSFRQGFYRFKPDGSKIEFLRNTDNNSWGVGFSEEGLLFGSTANRNPSVYMPIPNRYYERVRGWSSRQLGSIAENHLFEPITEKVRQVDHHGGYTAAAGHALYTARSWPREYWNRTAFVAGPTGHLVGTFLLTKNGSDFRSRYTFNILASDDEWTAPIAADVGPDGQLWVIDWYNYIVQHNPTPAGFETGKGNAYETPLRDKKHGRIYRVVARTGENSEPFSLQNASREKLVRTLAHPNMLWRQHAQRLLVERGERDVVPALIELVENRDVDAIGLNVGAIHALWTLAGLGALESADGPTFDAGVRALKHPSAGVRRSAALVLPQTDDSVAALLDAGLLDDADAQVRLAALLALSDLPPSPRAARQIAAVLQDGENVQDRWIPDAATSAAANNALAFLSTDVEQPTPALLEATQIVAEHFARSRPGAAVGDLTAALVESDTGRAGAVVSGLSRGWPENHRVAFDDATEAKLLTLVDRLPTGAKGSLVRLATLWGSESLEKHVEQIATALLAQIENEDLNEQDRVAAARQLIAFRPEDDGTVKDLVTAITPRTPPTLAAGLLGTLSASRSAATGPAIIARFGGLSPAARKAALRVLLARVETTRSLLNAVEEGKLSFSDLALDQKQALASHRDRRIRRRARELLEQGGGLPNPDRQKVLEQLLPVVAKQEGDAEAGMEVFKKQCAKCHVHGKLGTRIGPDLTGMAVHTRAELLTQIIDPSRSVEGNYRQYLVSTLDGRVLTGLLASETKTTIELYDAEGKKHVLLREDIDELLASPKSLMPDGFEKQVKPDEIADLLAFLTKRGKYLPLPLEKVATIASTQGMFYDENNSAERLIFRDWSPKTFQGVPFRLVDPQGTKRPNVVMLYGPQGKFPPRMPKSVTLPCNSKARAIHFLSGVSGWGAKRPLDEGTVSMIVRLHYADGRQENHELRNGRHFADYIGRFDVPESKLAFRLRQQQIRYLAIEPKRDETIKSVELVKGPDRTAPVVMAVTVEVGE